MARNPGSRRTVTTISQLDQALMVMLRNAAIAAKPAILEYLKRKVYENFYMQYTPAEYERTYEMVESLEINIRTRGKKIYITRNHNTDKIHWNPDANQHGSSSDYSEWVVQTVEEGSSGPAFGRGFWTEPRPFWDDIIEEAEDSGEIYKMVWDEM
jgi:hypothetical protein